jgi:hypothetical protein
MLKTLLQNPIYKSSKKIIIPNITNKYNWYILNIIN